MRVSNTTHYARVIWFVSNHFILLLTWNLMKLVLCLLKTNSICFSEMLPTCNAFSTVRQNNPLLPVDAFTHSSICCLKDFMFKLLLACACLQTKTFCYYRKLILSSRYYDSGKWLKSFPFSLSQWAGCGNMETCKSSSSSQNYVHLTAKMQLFDRESLPCYCSNQNTLVPSLADSETWERCGPVNL